MVEKKRNGLAGSLFNHVQPTLECVTAAVRTGDSHMIEMMLSRSVNFDGPARCSTDLSHIYRPKGDRVCCPHLSNPSDHWPTSPLAEAIRSQDTSLIGRLEEYGALQIAAKEASQLEAAIMAAADVEHLARVEALLSIDPNDVGLHLSAAIEAAIRKKNIQILRALFIHHEGRDLKYTSRTYLHGVVPSFLSLALETRFHEAVEFFLHHSRQNPVDSSAITEAVRWGEKSIIVELHDLGLVCPSTWTTYGPRRNHPWPNITPHISDGPDFPRSEQPSPLNMAIWTGNSDLLSLFLKWGADPGDVRYAVKVGAEDQVRLLLDHGAKPLGIKKAIEGGHHNILRLLLEHDTIPTEIDTAVEVGDVGMLRLLLQHGADPANSAAFVLATLSDNATLLHVLSEAFRARYPRGKPQFGIGALRAAVHFRETSVLNSLFRLNLDVNSYEDDFSLLQVAIIREKEAYIGNLFPRYYRYHVRSRSSPSESYRKTMRRSDCEWRDIISQLLDAGASTNEVNRGKTVLLYAIQHQYINSVELLLDRDADINRPARWGLSRTPIQEACESGNLQIVELLLRRGALVNAPPAPNGGATALQLAVIQGSPIITRLLLDNGADIHAAPAVISGRTALEGAAEHGRLSVLHLLLVEGWAGFQLADLQKAKKFAEKQMHPGCVERLNLALVRFGKGQDSRVSLEL